MKPVNGVEEKKGANTLVKILAAAAEIFEPPSLIEQRRRREMNAEVVERLIANGTVGRGDEADQVGHGLFFLAARQQIEQAGKDFVTVFTLERESNLGREEAIFKPDVIARTAKFAGEVALALREFCQSRAQMDRPMAGM